MLTRSSNRGARLAILVLAASMALAAVPALAAKAPAHLKTVTSTVTKHLASSGVYTVIVSMASMKTSETVAVKIGSQVQSGVPLGPGATPALAFFVHLHSKKLVVSAVGTGPKAHFTVAASSAAASIAAPSTGPYTHLAWADDFSGPANTAPNPSNWTDDGNSGCGDGTLSSNTSSLANASLNGQGLSINALQDPSGAAAGFPYSSAQLDTNNHYTFTYGEVQARIQLPAASGLCSAFWLLEASTPTNPCPSPCNEIDIMESISPYPNVAFADLHGPVQGSPNFQQWQAGISTSQPLSAAYHTWGLIWSPGRITWTLDGLPYATATPSTLNSSAQWAFDNTAMRIVLDLAVGGWPGAPTSTAGFPASLRVAWVRVYQ
jgi:beta-glucanase (GH16 family)